VTKQKHKDLSQVGTKLGRRDELQTLPSGAGDPALYFSEVLIEVNLVFSLAPMPFTTAMMTSEIPAAINPYSIAVAPVSSAQNFRTNAIMGRRYATDA
jgi:hypothetical protein